MITTGELAFSLCTGGLLALTVAPLSSSKKWWIRVWEFPRQQLATLAFALLCAGIAWSDWTRPLHLLLLVLAAGCLFWHLFRIAPYTRLGPRDVPAAIGRDADRRLRLLIANVQMENRHAARLLELVERCDPDLVLTVETDRWWEERLEPLERNRPHTLRKPLDNTYGMHLFSRFPLSGDDIRFLVEPDVPSLHPVATLRSGEAVQLHCLHPAPPSPTESEDSKERDTELQIIARASAGTDMPTIVMGDLNDVAWSRSTRAFREISGLLDPRRGRGLYNSFHARIPFLRWPLDHIFHSSHFSLARLERLAPIGSDHFPILAELELTGAARPLPDESGLPTP